MLGQTYVLKGMVQCVSHHFTVAIKDGTHWVYVDDMCDSVKNYTSCQDLLHSNPKGWFFAIFEKSPIRSDNCVQTNSSTCEMLGQDSCNFHVGISAVNVCSTDILPATISSALVFYAICFSVFKSCSYWNSDTIDAIVECGSAFFINTIKCQCSSVLPQNINIFGANIDVKFVTSSKGNLVCTSSHSKLGLERLILQIETTNTGFLFYFSNHCYGCIFHKTSRSTTFFVIVMDKSQRFEIVRTSNTNSLVQTICDSMTNNFNSNETEYLIQGLLCTCQKSNAEKQKILKCHKSSKQKMQVTMKRKKSYAQLEPSKKKKCLDKWDLDSCIRSFEKKVREGPYYICSVCNRILYRKTVTELKKDKYSIQHLFTAKKSFDNKEYICKTCNSKLLKGQVPCQAVHNKLMVDEIPSELACLEKLEQILIAQRIVFEKIVVMPKGQQRKIKGAICNVPVECDQTCSVLPRPPERSGIIMVKLKRKLAFRGHVYFQAVRPDILLNALNWLRLNNPLYSGITVNVENIDTNLTELQVEASSENESELCPIIDTPCKQNTTDDQNMEEIDDPLNEFRAPTAETCLQSVLPDYPVNVEQNNSSNSAGNEIFNIAPGENEHPVSFMTDKHCEELAFPVLFPTGRFGYTVERAVNLSPTKYFNARLLHYSGRFAMNPEYLFFAQFIIEQKKVSDSINIALSKVHGQSLTASHLRSNIQSLQNLICQNQAYLFLRQIPGTPPYWQKFMYEVVAMVKQLGIPTWFMTLSCADLRWPELFQIIARTQGLNLTEEKIEALSYSERCSMLNLNPVVVAKHFQYRVETFFKEILLTRANPIGKIVHYALRIEFQMRGSPHLHALIWTSDCPKLTHETKQDYIDFIDAHVQAYLPDNQTDSELYELVGTYQKHNHSKTCRKYRNVPCRFNFGAFFTNRTVVAEPLSQEMDEELKRNLLNKRKEILSLVKEEIDKVLNPNKPQHDLTKTEGELLNSLGITEEQYYWALSVSADSDFDLHLKRPLDSCFINNYFVAGLKGFRANVDLQPVFNHYKCVTYVCSYFTKDESECSQAIMNAAKEGKASNLTIRETLRKIGAAFLSTREVSSQECVYRCMPELWLRKVFPKTVFVSTDLPENRVRVAKSQPELNELDSDSTDIYKSNIIERYCIRPNAILAVDNLCLAEFAAYYYKEYKSDCTANDAQPEILTDDATELFSLPQMLISPANYLQGLNCLTLMKS